jgi:photosystem II stability/assembly factor-like uncharacterized protein
MTPSSFRCASAACLALLTTFGFARAQAPWVRQSPLPGAPVGQAAFSATRAYLVGTDQQPVESTDGGWTWHSRPLGNGGFLAITFVDATHGWMVGNHTSLGHGAYRTSDGGATWTEMPNVPFGSYYKMQFITPTHGWIAANTVLFETFDAGDSWSLVNTPQPFQARFAFRDAQVGLLGTGNGMFRTTNGGSSWTQVSNDLPDSIRFLDPSTVLVSLPWQFGPGDFLRSTDAGQSWTTIDVPGVSLENPVVASPTTIVANAAGIARSDLYRSRDGGLTWSLSTHGTWWPFEGGAFLDASNGLELAYGGQIFRTQDAGATWRQVSSGMTTEPMQDIAMLDGSRGVAVGYDGTVFVTQDGGTQWRADRPGMEYATGDTLLGVSVVQPAFVFAAGLYGNLVKSYDAGATWQGVHGPGAGMGDYWTCKFVTPDEGWIAGGFRAIYHTLDGGQTWTQQYVVTGSSEAIYKIDFTDALHGWAVGTFGGVLVTTDGGAHWTMHSVQGMPFGREIDMVDDQVGWFASRESYVARTIDGGSTWTQQPIPADPMHPEQFVFALSAVSRTECWAATTGGRVIHTTDAGASWQSFDTGFHGPYDAWNSMVAHADGNVWLAGDAGNIVRRLGTPAEAGAAFCFGDGSGTACPCGNESAAGSRAGCSSSIGVGGSLVASGQASIGADTLRLDGAGLPSDAPSLFFQGDARLAGGAGTAFGDGLRCVGGNVRRLGVRFAAGGTASFGGGVPSVAQVGGVSSAGVREYQAWYRNAVAFCSPSTFNLTNGVEVLWIP